MKKLLLLALATAWLPLCGMSFNPQRSFTGVFKINDDLYVGKANDDFYMAMERVDSNNIKMWSHYADNQHQKITTYPVLKSGGVRYFKSILNLYGYSTMPLDNELWIAYVSNKPITQKAQLNSEKNPSIEMFCTVITSPKALITTHMGISRTFENAGPSKQLSVPLHSFAAKVMLLENGHRKYMLTSPLPVMRDILLKAMPTGTVFVGDSEFKHIIEEAERDPQTLLDEDLDLAIIEGESPEQRKLRLDSDAQRMYDYYKIKEKTALLQSNPPRITRNNNEKTITIQNADGSPLVSCSTHYMKPTKGYEWMATSELQQIGLTVPYVLVDLEALANVKQLVEEYE